MSVFEVIMGILLILICIGLACFILMQEGKGGMGVLTGEQSDSFGRNAGKTLNTTLKTVTKYGLAALMVVVILINVVIVYF